MATTGLNRVRRSSPQPNEWPPRQVVDDNFRKGTLTDNRAAKPAVPDCCCHDDECQSGRYEDNRTSGHHYQGGSQSDHEMYKVHEEKTSDEGSMTEAEIDDTNLGDVRATCHCCDTRKYDKSPREYPSHAYNKAPDSDQMTHYEKVYDENRSDGEEVAGSPATVPPRNLRDYVKSVNLPQALMALRKLERLKELQRRRDLSERHYSQEIKRLIGEHFFSNKFESPSGKIREQRIAGPGNRPDDDTIPSREQRIRAGGFSKELGPCGTMTMITELDCGCIRETTTPIFNRPIARIKKCSSHRYQTCTVPEMSSANAEELTYRPVQDTQDRLENSAGSPTRAKARFLPDPATYQKLQKSVSRDLESGPNRRSHSAQPRMRRSSRPISPTRNFSPVRMHSDTSSNSPRK